MRLDKWLWATRLYKTRTIAATACRAGQVRILDQNVKPAHEVRLGQIILARVGEILRTVKVVGFPERRVGAKLVAQFLEDQTPAAELQKPRDPYFRLVPLRPRGAGRPTKKERRDLGRIRQDLEPPAE